ncbi:MAG: M36 family metallopeptidase [Blastocatellales bacterium]|nr:M36 family metallopeptidase [Blastocatellales bacterium]
MRFFHLSRLIPSILISLFPPKARIAAILLVAGASSLLYGSAAVVTSNGALADFDIRADRRISLSEPPPSFTGKTAIASTRGGNDRQRELPGTGTHTVMRWSSLSGSVSRVYNLFESLSSPSSDPPETIARNFLRSNADLYRLDAQEVNSLRVIKSDRTLHSGAVHITLQQEVAGIEVFQGAVTVHIDRTGAVVATGGELFADAPDSVNLDRPAIGVTQALSAAAGFVDAQIPNPVVIVAPSEGASLKQVIESGAVFAREIQGRLVYFPFTTGRLRLAWEFTLWMKDAPDAYLVIVDAENAALLFRYNFTWYDENPLRPHGLVFTKESPRPANPFTGDENPPIVEREDRPFRAEPFNGEELFAASDPHYDWWAGRPANNLISNNTDTHLDRDSMPNQPDLPRLEAPDGNFTFPVNFALAPTTDDNARAAQVNLFYWINRFHNILYRFGFTESAGNFQTSNFDLGGLGNDAIEGDAQDGSGFNNANFSAPPDGQAGRVQMFLWNTATPQLDGDFDQGVIIHELTHGLSSRLIGNSTGLTGMQSRGMGEGWSDYFALVMLREEGDDPHGAYPIGQYVVNRYARGIRRFPYSTQPSVYPLTFARIADNTAVHPVGEIWCAALWEMRALLLERYGFSEGQRLSLQLVVDGMKLTPVAPTFVDARDAILLADRVANQGSNTCLIWSAFAKRGLGFSASTTDPGDASPIEAFDGAPFCSDDATLSLDRSNYLPGETLRIRLGDRNAGTTSVLVVSEQTGDSETITLLPETGVPGSYLSQINISAARPTSGDGDIQIASNGGDRIIVTYVDESTGGGGTATVTAAAGVGRERAVYADDVESGNRGWLATGTWAIDSRSSSSPTRSWRVSSSGNSAYQNVIALTSPLLDLTSVTDVSLDFAQSYELFNGFNYAIVEYSIDDGASWARAKASTSTQAAFALSTFRLPGLDGQSRARFRFRLQNSVTTGSNFWAVDDIHLTGRSGRGDFIPAGAVDAPTIARITPSFASPAGGIEVTVFGDNFTESSDMALTFDNTPAASLRVISPGVLRATVPAHAPGHAPVRIMGRRGATTFAPGFTYIDSQAPAPAPAIEAIAPDKGSLKGVTVVTIYGSGFVPSTRVSFGSADGNVTFINQTTLLATAPSRQMPGVVDVTVRNGGSVSVLALGFTYMDASPPQLHILAPAGGETFHLGGLIPVSWISSGGTGLLRHNIQLVYQTGAPLTSFEAPGSAQSFLLPLNPTLLLEPQARIRITAVDTDGNSVEQLSPPFAVEQRWVRRANLTVSVQRMQAAAAGGFVYSFGGQTGTSQASTISTVYRYDPAENIWSTLASSGAMIPNMPAGLNSGDAAVLNGKIYIPGGITLSSAITASHMVYSVENNSWSAAADQPFPVSNYSLAEDAGAYHLTGGATTGSIPTATARSFTAATGSWTELPAMNAARFGHESVMMNGKLYVAGGVGTGGGMASAEVYDFAEKQWSQIPPLNTPRAYGTSVLAQDISGNPVWVIVGGLNPATGAQLGAESYDPQSNRWSVLDGTFNPAVARVFLGGAAIGPEFFITGGSTPTFSTFAVERIRITPFVASADNQPPVLVAPAEIVGVPEAPIRFTATANDIGQTSGVTIEADGLPEGAVFTPSNPSPNSSTGRFEWTPRPEDAGKIFTLRLRAFDGIYEDVKVVRIRVVVARPLAIVNAADFRPGVVTPDSIAAIFGEFLSVRTETASALPLPLEMSGTRVKINGEPAPLFFVSPGQINIAVPPGIEPGQASVTVESADGTYSFGMISVASTLPAIFTLDSTGMGDAAALATPDGVFYQTQPFDVFVDGKPNILLLFGTGIRLASADAPSDDNGVAEAVTATIDGLPAIVYYAGAQGQFSGLDQLNLEIPAMLSGGPERRLEVRVVINGVAANVVTIVIR